MYVWIFKLFKCVFRVHTCIFIAPLDKGSKIEEVVTKIRTRKGLKVCLAAVLGRRMCLRLRFLA